MIGVPVYFGSQCSIDLLGHGYIISAGVIHITGGIVVWAPSVGW